MMSALTVDANFNDGLASKDGLVINGGSISITAADDGIRGKDSLVVKSGSITISAGGDALKSDNDEDADKGYILIENGNIDISCEADGFDAETDVLIKSGSFSVRTGGGRSVTPGDSSTKGISGNYSGGTAMTTFTLSETSTLVHGR
jgi:hypothetical protein